MTGPPGWQTPHYVLASAAFGHRTRTVTIGLFRPALRWKPQPEAGQYMPKRRAVVRERLDRWLTPTPVPQRNSPIAERPTAHVPADHRHVWSSRSRILLRRSAARMLRSPTASAGRSADSGSHRNVS